MKSTRILFSLVICGLIAMLASAQSPKKPKKDIVLSDYGKLPLSFEANDGQTDAHVKFLSRGRGYSLFLTGTEAVIALQKSAPQSPKQDGLSGSDPAERQKQTAGEVAALRMQLAGANTSPRILGAEELPGKVNYFIGNDPSKWRTNVPTYAKVKFENVYRGVDLVYYGNQGQLEYDFVVEPGADPSTIQLKFKGAGKLRVDGNGDLLLGAAGNEVRFEKPVIYQTANGQTKSVKGSYVLAAANLVGFRLGEYDRTQPLIIDPVLSYSTYLGGSANDDGFGIAVDSAGNAYVTGDTFSTNFPTVAGAFQPAFTGANYDAFVSKLDAAGSALVYSTYLGGGSDKGHGIAVDASGNAYVAGETQSSNFPTVNPFQSTPGGVFISKLNSTGSALVYSSYLGGAGDRGLGIAVDASGNAYLTGSTISSNFPTTANAVQPKFNGYNNFPVIGPNAFVTELNAAGSALVYSTFLGGNTGPQGDVGNGIVVDSSGNFYVTGSTTSTNFPTTANAFQATYNRTSSMMAFVAKFNPGGSTLAYSTYLGGSGLDAGYGIAANAAGNAFITGQTASSDFPTVNPLQAALGGGTYDAFVSQLNATGSALVYSTYLGGNGGDGGFGIALDASGDVYVTGRTSSTNFPTQGAIQSTLAGTTDAFITKLNNTGSAVLFSTYLGGSNGQGDEGFGIAVDSSGAAYVTGSVTSTNFPTANALQPTFGGGTTDAFVAKILLSANRAATTTSLASSVNPANLGQAVTFTATVTSSASGTPTGTVFFRDGSSVLGSAQLNASAVATFTTSSLAAGTHSITAQYEGDPTFDISTSAALSEVVNAADYSLSATPTSRTVPAGEQRSYKINISRTGGFTGSVTLSATGIPAHTRASFSPNPASGASSTLTVTTSGRTPVGTYTITITGMSGTLSHTTSVTLVVTKCTQDCQSIINP